MNQKITETIEQLMQKKNPVIIAIDGRCTSGKSTYALQLQQAYHGTLLRMDDFFLRPEQRTEERYETPGENVDHERFLAEVLQPLSRGEKITYRPFDCRNFTIGEEIPVTVEKLVIVEGSYSLREDLRPYYDFSIFMSVEPEIQLKRVEKRNPDKVQAFRQKWIPLEEMYIQKYRPDLYADIVIDTSRLW